MSGRSDILRHLELVRPPTAGRRVFNPPSRSLEETDFRTLIATAQNDIQRTNRPVELPADVALSPEQRSRLEGAADTALAHDSRTALVMLDGRPLLLDVPARKVCEEIHADTESDRVVTDIDTVVISREEKAADGPPTYEVLLRRLSGTSGSTGVSNLFTREERGSSRLERHDTGE